MITRLSTGEELRILVNGTDIYVVEITEAGIPVLSQKQPEVQKVISKEAVSC